MPVMLIGNFLKSLIFPFLSLLLDQSLEGRDCNRGYYAHSRYQCIGYNPDNVANLVLEMETMDSAGSTAESGTSDDETETSLTL